MNSLVLVSPLINYHCSWTAAPAITFQADITSELAVGLSMRQTDLTLRREECDTRLNPRIRQHELEGMWYHSIERI